MELNTLSRVIRSVFPTPFHFMPALLQKFPDPRPLNLTSIKKNRGNYMWDMAVCFSVGAIHQVDGAEMFLVTKDKAIREAAVVANCASRILSLADYKTSLGVT